MNRNQGIAVVILWVVGWVVIAGAVNKPMGPTWIGLALGVLCVLASFVELFTFYGERVYGK